MCGVTRIAVDMLYIVVISTLDYPNVFKFYPFYKQHSVPASANFKVLLLTFKITWSSSNTLNEPYHFLRSFTCCNVSAGKSKSSGSRAFSSCDAVKYNPDLKSVIPVRISLSCPLNSNVFLVWYRRKPGKTQFSIFRSK